VRTQHAVDHGGLQNPDLHTSGHIVAKRALFPLGHSGDCARITHKRKLILLGTKVGFLVFRTRWDEDNRRNQGSAA
jgi:hypothetical protein